MRKTGADRREEIVATAVEVLLAKGLAAATTRDVTNRLGVGAGLLSHYFTWADLRSLAFERIVQADLQIGLALGAEEPARRVMDDLIATAFDQEADRVWRVWSEASDLATSDPILADRVARATDLWRQGLAKLLTRGSAQGDWYCRDAEGASWRLIALFDGLVGLVLAPGSKLTRHAATGHLSIAIRHECEQPVVN